MKILDIGCEINKHKENPDDVVIGVDRVFLPSIDVVHDMEKFPYPFKDNEFDKVVMHQTLEHVSKDHPMRNDNDEINLPQQSFRGYLMIPLVAGLY